MDRETKARFARWRNSARGRIQSPIVEPPNDERPRYPERHPLAGQLIDKLGRFRERWGSDAEIQALLSDDTVPESMKAECRTANDWYLSTHALADRDAQVERDRQDAQRALARAAGLDPDRYVADLDYRQANGARVAAIAGLGEREQRVDRAVADLEAARDAVPAVIDPAAVTAVTE
jgi:hypothetical protein